MQGQNNTKFIYDTGSGYVTIPEIECFSCAAWKYNPADSSTYDDTVESYSTTSLAYGSANFKGKMGEDTVCLDVNQNHSCVADFAFFMITE